MRVSFIGMSNIGKSAWAQRVSASMGLVHFNCDALIQRKLGDAVISTGARGARDLAAWMGQPHEGRYAENSRRYMECEKEVLSEIFARLRDEPDLPAVIDTTGSVIYTDKKCLDTLRELTRVVYFEASDSHIEDLFKHYLANPKPVIWGDIYVPQAGETPEQTLQRCYPLLLRERAQKYKALAHVVVAFEKHRDQRLDMKVLLQGKAT